MTPAEAQGPSLYHTLKIETNMSFIPPASSCSFSRVANTSSMKENALLGKIPQSRVQLDLPQVLVLIHWYLNRDVLFSRHSSCQLSCFNC